MEKTNFKIPFIDLIAFENSGQTMPDYFKNVLKLCPNWNKNKNWNGKTGLDLTKIDTTFYPGFSPKDRAKINEQTLLEVA